MTSAAQAIVEMEQMGYQVHVAWEGGRQRVKYHHAGPLEAPDRAEQLIHLLYQQRADAIAFLETRGQLTLEQIKDFLDRHQLQGQLTWPAKDQAPVLVLYPENWNHELEDPMSLRAIIRQMFQQAWRQRGARINYTLPNGLHIVLYVARDDSNHLLIYRHHKAPSLAEWETVIARWPQALPDPLPAPEEKSDPIRQGLAASWRCPALPQKEPAPEVADFERGPHQPENTAG